MIPTKESINAAHDKIRKYIHRTPVLTSTYINQLTGAEVFFKCENLQKIGAFKARGGMNASLSLDDEELKRGICTHSSGNHAQALAFAARELGTKAYIVMPRTAPVVKVNAVKDYGAEVIFCEPTQKAREATIEQVVAETGAVFIHPYNNYRVIEGQATAAKELIEDVPGIEAIVVPVGGGGLASGTSLSAKFFGNYIKVYCGEPENVNDAWQSLQENKIVPQTGKLSIADGLLTSLGTLTFPIISDQVSEIFTVSEDEIRDAMKMVWERMKIIIEPSSAVPLAAVIKNPGVFKGKKTGIIITGGNVDLNHLPF